MNKHTRIYGQSLFIDGVLISCLIISILNNVPLLICYICDQCCCVTSQSLINFAIIISIVCILLPITIRNYRRAQKNLKEIDGE